MAKMEKVLKTPEEIYQKIEEVYKTEKGKKFIAHLIRSFFPTDKTDYIWEKKPKPIFCCVSGVELTSKSEAMEAMFNTTPEEFGSYLKKAFVINTNEGMEEESKETIVHPAIEKLNGKILGIESPESDKFICKEVQQQLYNFYASEILKGNGHMNWLAKRIMTDRIVVELKNNNQITPQEEKIVDKKVNKPHKITLGDMSVLQQLKEKMEKSENK